MLPTVLTFAGSDSAGLAGIQVDNRVQSALGAHCLNVVTAVTAQNNDGVAAVNAMPADIVQQQVEAVEPFGFAAMKSGLVVSVDQADIIVGCAGRSRAPYVCDPVLAATSGDDFAADDWSAMYTHSLIPSSDLVTPNLHEAEMLTGLSIESPADMEAAAEALVDAGAEAVYLKGGHLHQPQVAQDFFLSDEHRFWLTSPRLATPNTRGTGCAFASAAAAALACGYALADAVVIAKMAINQGLRQAEPLTGSQKGGVRVTAFPDAQHDLPVLTATPGVDDSRPAFPDCGDQPLGLYPVVDSSEWLERLMPLAVTTAQLRIKSLTGEALKDEISQAVALGRQHDARVFINDHWQLAIELGAYGVHLGQEDLDTADLAAIQAAGLRLGTSTHCHYEVARAHALKPSYIACGPVYETTTKEMPWVPHGPDGLAYWQRVLDYPVVAIGGINEQRIAAVAATGVSGVAMITAITLADDPEQTTRKLIQTLS